MLKEIFGNRVLVKQDESKKKEGRFSLPDKATENPNTGTIIKTNQSSGLEIGDRIIYPKGSGVPVSFDGDDTVYLIIDTKSIYAKL